ncbi:MAG: D-alanine--D-alanine ligase [Streptococcaceae bacterium]|jgi:D-alanine-D-alanine ligase|nr:D-alanine--D-alanine ligase [Streptococcaceae bacterium]
MNRTKKKKLIVLYGGRSAEHEISMISAFNVLNNIDYRYYEVQLVFITKEGEWIKGPVLNVKPAYESTLKLSYATSEFDRSEDYTGTRIEPSAIYEAGAMVFPVLHGPNGEDGTIQGFLETLKMPYVGCGVLASASGMDKIMTKYVLQVAGIPQVPYVPVMKFTYKQAPLRIFEKCEGQLRYPMFIKPANMGSSVGISKAESRIELQKALEEAFKYDTRVIVEQAVDAREIEVAILGNDDVRTSEAGELIKDVPFYDYNAKYIDNKVTMQIPANVDSEIMKLARQYAKEAYEMIDGSGLARCDFFLTKNNELYLNELNTMPGFTQYSMYPLLWKNMGLEYGDLVEVLLYLAEKRFEARQELF